MYNPNFMPYQQQGNPYQMYNPQAQAQQRLMQMEQQYQNQMQQFQQPQQMQQQPQLPSIKPVTSIEEVRGITPNFDGSKMYFEDVTNNKMYIKYMDLNGMPVTKVFSIDNKPIQATETVQGEFVSKEEFNALKAEIDQYKGIINQFINQGGAKNE